MNAAEAKREATRILAGRLRAWGLEGDHIKQAENFMLDLALAGWIWMPVSNRPTPPKPFEACLKCGRHVDSCLCDRPQTKPDQPATDVTARVLDLRRNVVPLRPAKTKPEGDESA